MDLARKTGCSSRIGGSSRPRPSASICKGRCVVPAGAAGGGIVPLSLAHIGDTVSYERNTLSPDTIEILTGMGHHFREGGSQGVAEVILDKGDWLEGGIDRRQHDGGAAGR